ncbi:MAG: M48 family metallopeptidase [Anaerolineae bacterium]|nr:M48 family metallopeptidase [Anaerolineae bacterium]
MTILTHEIETGDGKLTIEISVDSRLRTMARWSLNGETVKLRVPRNITRTDLERLIQDIVPRILKQRKRAARTSDVNLMERAAAINAAYFNNELSWNSIRWVSNMQHRLGSCTTGGTTDGDIRISDRIRRWPQYVVDYILAHEICHRKYPNHSQEFWDYLASYPHTQKAIGFIEGIGYAEGRSADDMLD